MDSSLAVAVIGVGGTVIVGVVGFWASVRNKNRTAAVSQRAVEAAQRTVEPTEQGQLTDRYLKAIEQLGSDKLDVRIGGIYVLERIARESEEVHRTVMEVLSAFVREHSREQWAALPDEHQPGADPPERTTRPDVQAAVTVIGRRSTEHDRQPVNLIGANLTSANLEGAHLAGVILRRADLTGANLAGADLTGADLTGANLPLAKLHRAKLTSARLSLARLAHASLMAADFTGADLDSANLARANLTGANLDDADLTGANLARADLTGADLTGADLTEVLWSPDAEPPKGWERVTGSGRLRRIAPAAETERNQTE